MPHHNIPDMKKISRLILVIFFCLPGAPGFGASAQWVHYDANGNLVYFSDDLGNRLADFSYAGYHGGGVALPVLTVKQTVTPSGGDDTASIQSAINAVAALTPDANGFRGAVLLKAGNYNISGRINVNANGIVLRGEGNTTSGTVLKVSKASAEVIYVAGSGGRTLTGSSVSITDTYVPLAATTVTVSSASGFAVGDQIAINRPWTQSWIDAIGMNGIWSPNSGIYFERTVTAVTGNQISFDVPLGNPIEQKFVTGNVQHYTDTGRVQECGVENLYVLCTDTNAVGGARAVLLDNCRNCWTHDVTCDTFNNGFSMSPNSKYCTIQDCVYANGQGGGSARPGCYNIEGEMCLYQRCSTTGIHPVGDGSWILTTQSDTAGPDVFFRLDSYSDHTAAQLHARWAASQLIDNLGGSSISSVSIQNLGTGGNGHGWTAGYSIAYNCRCSFSVEEPTVDHHYNWIIGGIGTVNPPGNHTNTGPGTYDATNVIVTPGSLYLAQLKARLGSAAVENIGYQLFGISASPGSQTVTAAGNATFTVSVSDTNNLQTRVTLGASGLPAGATAGFSPSTVIGSGTSTLTVSTSASTPAGSYTITVNGTCGNVTHTATVTLVVNNFSLSATPSAQTVTAGNGTSCTATVSAQNGFNGTVSFTVSGLPAGATAGFNPTSVTGSGSSTLSVSTTTGTAGGTYPLTITGTSGSLVQTTAVSLTINAPPPPDFSLSAAPSSLTITQGNNGASTITVNPLNGFNGSVSLSASGLPSGVTAAFNPSSTASTSTLTLTAGSSAATGPATVTVAGTSGSLQHTTTLSLTVNAATGGLPAGWTDVDVGAVGLAGNAAYHNGTFTVSGSGSDIWTTGDQFNYAYQSAAGDTTIIARVVSENGTQSYAKAGVMIRESVATNAVEASILLTPTNGVAMEVRPATGASSLNLSGWVKGPKPPQWVKLVRAGNTFTASYSADGSTWTQIASTNVTMASSATAGLAVSAHDNTSLNTATFDNVSITGGSLNLAGVYQIQNLASGLVLNNQGSLTNGSAITQWTVTTSSNLDWQFIATSNGYYQINSCKSALDAAVQGASTANGAGIVQWAFGSTGNDQWQPVLNNDGTYTFFNLHSGLVLEDPGSSTNKATQMDQWSSTGGSNQKWNLLKQ